MSDHGLKYGIIILAAGGSARLGRPKQLLSFNNGSLLKNVVDAASLVPDAFTVVVTGAYDRDIQEELSRYSLPVSVCFNQEWQTGIASSIRKGVAHLQNLHPGAEACILTVCDQPYVGDGILSRLTEVYEATGKSVVASSYAGTEGTPALFSRQLYGELESLTGDEGAKKIIQKHRSGAAIISFREGVIDIDTEQDYEGLSETENNKQRDE